MALMQFTLSSCFATPSESVAILVLVDCPNLHRPPAFIPTLHHSSVVSLTAPFSSSPISLQPILVIPPNLTTIYTLQQKPSIFPYKFRKTYCRIYLVISSVAVKRKGKERKESENSTRLVLNLSGAGDGLVLFVCLFACLLGRGGGSERNFIYLLINYFLDYWILLGDIQSRGWMFLLAYSVFLWWMMLSFGGCLGIGGCGCDEEEGIIVGVW